MEQTTTIGPAAAACGLTPRAIRLYERRGLLSAGQRTASGYRRYTDVDLSAMRFIRRCRDLGLSLAEITEIIRTRRAGAAPCGTVRRVLEQHIIRIERHIVELAALRDELIATGTATTSAGGQATYCPLIER